MAMAETMNSSSRVAPRGFYKAILDSFPSLTIAKSTNAAAVDVNSGVSKSDNAVEPSPEEADSSPKGKPEKKKKKKNEIVSSSSAVPRVEVCTGKKCRARGSEELLTQFRSASDGRVDVAYTKCMKECKQGMNVRGTKDGKAFDWHHEVSADGVQPILCKHFDW